MYNALKNKFDTYLFNNQISGSYKKISEIENEEEVYLRKTKLAVVVKDEEVGRRIYNIIKSLEKRGSTIETPNATMRISKYISDRENTVQVFYINFAIKYAFWNDLTDLQKLKELVSFVNALKNEGYIIDKSIFDYKKCDQIAALLSFFKPIEEGKEDENECIIEYIHYILSKGKDLKAFYQEIEKQGLVATEIFPYGVSVTKMFYQYYKAERFKENIITALENEEVEVNYTDYGSDVSNPFCRYNYLMFNEENFRMNSEVINQNSKYTIYKDNIKIYHNINFDHFSKFCEKLIYPHYESIYEVVENYFIYDLDFKIVGHKFEISDEMSLAVEQKFISQNKIIDFVKEIRRFYNIFDGFIFDDVETGFSDDFEMKKSLLYVEETFFFKELIDLYNFMCCSKNKIQIQVTEIFFKLFFEYLKNKYNDLCNEEKFFQIEEVRYLNPILVREFINYSLGKEVNYVSAAKELYVLLSSRNYLSYLNSKVFYYDSRFIYTPERVSYLFDYEVKNEYGIEIKDEDLGKEFTLPDGRKLKTFPTNTKKVSEIESSERALRNKIFDKFRDFGENVYVVGIKQIIYKKSIRRGVYEVIGYVTSPYKGNRLTDDFLASLSNKDFLLVAAELFTNFDLYSIPLETIYMDEDHRFYIDIYDKNCIVKKSECRSSYKRTSTTYIHWIVNRLILKHPECVNTTLIDLINTNLSRREMKLLVMSYDTYCSEHGIYFDGIDELCPICLKTKYLVDDTKLSTLVFEDEYAKHYNVDTDLNLKIYKKSKVDISLLEEKVIEMMTDIKNDPQAAILKYHQECFIPCKKAVDSDNKFVGYVYKVVDFNKKNGDGSCISIKDLKNMSNLPRIKSLIRLIMQVKTLVSEGKGFIKNPFDNVFLIKGYSKQVQLVNIDFISNKANSEDTFKWIYQYVFDAITSDENIQIEVFDYCLNDLDTILRKLEMLPLRLTKYCSLHNMYYEDNFLFCPKCIPDAEVKDFGIIPVEKSEIFNLKQINEGGESFIYDYDARSVVKVFKETEINVSLKNKIIAKLMKKNKLLNQINEQNRANGIKYKYIIPSKLFIDKNSKNVFAYLMEKVNGKPISTLRDKSQVEALGFTKQDVLEILITVGEGIEALHEKANIYIGDLNGRNILFDTNKNVYFLDFDGMGIDEVAPEFCTDGYVDPISKKNNNITMKDDWYSFAVQAFYYLTYTHPFNGVYYSEEDGKKVALDIPEKMERRISLLGSHGMDPPAVAEKWYWMNTALENSFLKIFEGNNRKSIVPLLKKQYNQMYGNIPEGKKVKTNIRVNPKFIAKKLTVFNDDVINVINIINQFSAVYKDKEDKHYLLVLGKEGQTLVNVNLFDYYKNIVDVILSDDEKFAFVIFEDTIVILDVEGNTQVCTKKISDPNNVVVNGSTLYFNLDNIINELTFESRKLVKEQKINFLAGREIKRFYVQSNSKFVQVKRIPLEKVDKIYCNSQLLCNIDYNSDFATYNIVYDEITNVWLVVNSEGNAVLINSNDGSYEQIEISSLDDFNIENITFYNGKIYFPDENFLYIINVNNQYALKKMECSIMTPDSKVCSISNDGFNVIVDNSIYEIRRG